MQLGKHIKQLRHEKSLSQEKLAEMVYVSRQTISNWENDKSYPDINSLVLLSQVLDVTIDQLIKEDIEMMEEQINQDDIRKFGYLSNIFAVMMLITIITPIPLVHYLSYLGLGIWLLIFAATFYISILAEKEKKRLNIQTYKEILSFMDGKQLDKINQAREEGKRPYQKIIGQFGLALIVALYLYFSGRASLNFFGLQFDIGIFIIPLVILVLIATTNSVNLTDGLDGLAGGVSFVYLLFFGIILTLFNTVEFNNLAIMSFSLCGGLLGFLLFNCFPAKIFMGDTGSLALGGFIGVVAVLTGLELILPIMGIMFVLSAVSDILQVAYFKKTKGKRIFLMAPLHHHFEQKGVHENRIVIVYISITAVMSIITLLIYLL